MTELELWTHGPIAIAIGKSLLNSLWQAALVAGGLAGVSALFRSSRIRYAAACCALLLVSALPLRTIAQLAVESEGVVLPAGMLPTPVGPADDFAGSQSIQGLIRLYFGEVLPWVTPVWLLGLVLFTLKNFVTWFGSRRIRWRGVCAVTADWQQRLNALRVRLGISGPVELLESCMTQIPIVIGHMRPVILLPVGFVSGLPAEQIEVILMHELSHVRRHDYLVNLLQTLVESALFFNPAALWISRRIRTEREHCCDDDIVRITKDPRGYAAALIALEVGRAAPAENAIAATGGTLVTRIRRLLYPREPVRLGFAPVLIAILFIVAASLLLTARPTPAQSAAQLPQPAQKVVSVPPQVAEVQPAPSPRQTRAPSAVPVISQEPPSSLRKWLDEDVAYIITGEERAAFQNLRSDEEREQFIQSFWLRRDPTPGTPENEFREDLYKRIAYANEKFGTSSVPGWKTDRGRAYINWGPPDEKETHPADEMWLYRYIEGLGNSILLEFVDPLGTGEFRLMTPIPTSTAASGPVAVLGAVRAAGVYILQGQKTLFDMLSMAQGTLDDAVEIQISRGQGQQQQTFRIPVSELLSGRRNLNMPILAGDRIEVLRK